jgi:cytidylate kinase
VARVHCDGGLFFAKLRLVPAPDPGREAWALRCLRGRGAPRLVLATSVRQVLADLAARGELRALRRVDLRGGSLLVTRAAPGRAPEAFDDVLLGRVARQLAELHRVRPRHGPPLLGGATAPAMLRYLRHALLALSRCRFLDARVLAGLRRRLEAAARHVERTWLDLEGAPRALCHGDLRREHLVVGRDGAVTLIDFDHAGLGDPMVDLCRFAAFAPLSPAQELCLLDAYADAAPRCDIERYFIYRPLGALFEAVAAAYHLAGVMMEPRRRVDASWLWQRIRTVEARLSRLLEVTVRVPRRAAEPSPVRRVVVIDGTAGSGKTLIASALARRLGVPHVNTGAAYRAAALIALELGLSPDGPGHAARLVRRLARLELRLTCDGGISVLGRPLFASLDLWPVEATVAAWARHAEVRAALRPVIRRALRGPGGVIEGRGVAAELRPDADAVFFVEADPAVRAKLVRGRAGAGGRQLLAALARRDRMDRTRAVAPLSRSPHAVRLQSSLDVDAVAARMERALR